MNSEKKQKLSLKKKSINDLNREELSKIKGGTAKCSLEASLSCSNSICDAFSVGPRC